MIYLVTFALSTLLMYASDRCKGSLRVMLAAAAIALPCLLAGLRDKEVGVDVLSYAYWQYGDAKTMGLAEFMAAEASLSAPGWNVLTWLSCHLTGSLAVYLTAVELACMAPVYAALRKIAPGGEWAGWLAWLCLCYAFSMNGMRQSVAVGFVLLSYVYVREHRPLAFLVCIAVACLFHQTALFGLLLWPLVALLRSSGRARVFFGRWQGIAVGVILLASVALAIVFGDRVVVALSVLKDSYAYQVAHLGANDVSWAYLYLLAVVATAWLVARHVADASPQKLRGGGAAQCNSDLGVIAAVACVGCLLYQLNLVSDTLGRLGAYFVVFTCPMAAWLAMAGRGARGGLWLLLGGSLVFFVVMHLVLGKSGVWPYASAILGIG